MPAGPEGREAVFKFLARDVLWEARADFPDAGVHVGHNGVREFFERFRPLLGEMWFEPDEFRCGGRGEGSGPDFVESQAWIFTVRGRAIAHVKQYASKRAALNAVGPEE